MSFIKCCRCKCMRDIVDFEIYKGNRRKSCLKCKANNAKYKTNTTKKEKPKDDDGNLMSFIRHQKMYKKLLVEYKIAVGHSVHMYNFKPVLAQIRDKFIVNFL